VTGAVSSVKGADFQNLPSGGAQQALQGRAAGVNIIRNGGAPGDAGSIQIRGFGTVNNADPLVVIDGVPAGSMNDVNPNDIESIEILKDASASAIYGTRAANGVIIITTKRGAFDNPIGSYGSMAMSVLPTALRRWMYLMRPNISIETGSLYK
jgi:TonB-dependent SusC/RagA subfamily outer membrane receptor